MHLHHNKKNPPNLHIPEPEFRPRTTHLPYQPPRNHETLPQQKLQSKRPKTSCDSEATKMRGTCISHVTHLCCVVVVRGGLGYSRRIRIAAVTASLRSSCLRVRVRRQRHRVTQCFHLPAVQVSSSLETSLIQTHCSYSF